MNLDHLQKKLLAAARADVPSARVPLAFEKRILAQMAARAPLDLTFLWSRALWRATVPCLALTVILAGYSLFPALKTSSSATTATPLVTTSAAAPEDLSEVFEATLLASSDQLTSLDFLEDN